MFGFTMSKKESKTLMAGDRKWVCLKVKNAVFVGSVWR